MTDMQEIDAIEARAGSYGALVLFAFDDDLTVEQGRHCVNVLRAGHAAHGRELAAQYGPNYPLEALARRIDYAIEQQTPEKGAQRDAN